MFKLASNPCTCISPDSVGGVLAGESRFADIHVNGILYPASAVEVELPAVGPPALTRAVPSCNLFGLLLHHLPGFPPVLMYKYNMINCLNE